MATPKEQPQDFPSTWWSLIGEALAEGSTVRNAALEQLVLRYTPPLRAHLVLRRRLDQESAEELLQTFLVEKIAAQYLLQHADRSRGKFRALLLRSLDNFYVDWVRARGLQPETGNEPSIGEASVARHAVDAFDVAWARQFLDEVLAAMLADCEMSGQTDAWGVFECRLLRPTREGSEPLAYEAVCERFGFASPEQASNALVTAKRKFQRAFERVAAGYQHDGEKSDDVLRELIRILSQAGPLQWQQVPDARRPPRVVDRPPYEELEDAEPALLARLLELAPSADWQPEELSALLRHQLAQPLADMDLEIVEDSMQARCQQTVSAPLATLGDLLTHPAPPLPLVEAAKRYGRRCVRGSETVLPAEIASALYFGSIAAALVRHNRRITTSDDELLRYGFQSLNSRPWLDPRLAELFRLALEKIDAQSP